MRLLNYLIEKTQKSPIVYHGSYAKDIKNFHTKRKFIETGVKTFGAYFTDNIELARTFGAGYIYKCKLKFNKIIDMTKWKPLHADEKFVENIPELTKDEIDHHLRFDYYGHDSPYHTIETLDGKYDLLKRWRRAGYDGVAFREYHQGEEGITYVPFNDSQVKIIEKIK